MLNKIILLGLFLPFSLLAQGDATPAFSTVIPQPQYSYSNPKGGSGGGLSTTNPIAYGSFTIHDSGVTSAQINMDHAPSIFGDGGGLVIAGPVSATSFSGSFAGSGNFTNVSIYDNGSGYAASIYGEFRLFDSVTKSESVLLENPGGGSNTLVIHGGLFIDNKLYVNSDTFFNGVVTNMYSVAMFDSINDPSNNVAIVPVGRQLYSASIPTVDWAAYALATTEGTTVQWGDRQLRTGGTLAVDWANRTLVDPDGVTVNVDWAGYTLNAQNIVTLNWHDKYLGNSNVQSVDWGNNLLNDMGNGLSINWDQRILADSAGNTVLDWHDVAGVVGNFNIATNFVAALQAGQTNVTLVSAALTIIFPTPFADNHYTASLVGEGVTIPAYNIASKTPSGFTTSAISVVGNVGWTAARWTQ